MAAADTATVLVDLQVISNVLTSDQLARVAALTASRSALVARGGVFSGTGSADAMDLVNVARYIETGQDPWADLGRKAGEQ